MSVLDERNSCNDGIRQTSRSPSDDYDASSSQSSSGSQASYSDHSEDEEWQQNVDTKGELFFVRTESPTGRSVPVLSSTPVPPSKSNSSKFAVRPSAGLKSGNNGTAGCEDRPKLIDYTEVLLTVNDKRANLGRRSTQLEHLLGIIPGTTSLETATNDKSSAFVSIRALVPGSEAARDINLRIGALIHKINDTEVTWSNLDDVLASQVSLQSQQVKLTLAVSEKAGAISSDHQPACSNVVIKKSSKLYFPKLVTGKEDDVLYSNGNDNEDPKTGHNLSQLPHGVLYLALGNSESSSDLNEDILYQFPAASNKLVAIRGALFTINHIMPDVFGSPSASSSMLIDSQLVHVCYAREEKEVLLLAMPAHFATVFQLTKLTRQVFRSLIFQYKTLHNCFADKSHSASLNHLFALLFMNNMRTTVASQDAFKDRPFLKLFGLPQFLPLPSDLQCSISDILSELESSDFADLSEDHYGMRRLYNVLGSLLFYKGYLACSHLSSDDVGYVSLYLEGNGLMETSRVTYLSQLVVWREVHRNWISNRDESRWFLLVVGRNHSLLAVLLEAGGCAMRAVGPQSPDPFYVEHCRSTLVHLEVLQVPASLDSWLDWPLTPILASAESMSLFQSGKVSKVNVVAERLAEQKAASKSISTSRLSLGSLSSWHQVTYADVNTSSPKRETVPIGETDSDTTSLSLTASGTSDDMTPILGRRDRRVDSERRRESWSDANSQEDEEVAAGIVKSGPSHRYLPSVLDLTNMGGDLPAAATRDRNLAPSKLTFGQNNVLFHYVHLDSSQGVLVCPTRNFSLGQDLNSEVMQNFKSSCLVIQQTLRSQFVQGNKQDQATEDGNRDDSYVENGLLFSVVPPAIVNKGSVNGPLTYWVVGRKFLHSEFYVCYHDSCPQTTMEMAFQLAFGLST